MAKISKRAAFMMELADVLGNSEYIFENCFDSEPSSMVLYNNDEIGITLKNGKTMHLKLTMKRASDE